MVTGKKRRNAMARGKMGQRKSPVANEFVRLSTSPGRIRMETIEEESEGRKKRGEGLRRRRLLTYRSFIEN